MGTVWRPALRCDSVYRDYIDSIFESTSLDKNQIMRLMMFVAAHSSEFKGILMEYKKDGVTDIPVALWHCWEDAFWLNQTYSPKRGDTTPGSIDKTRFIVKGNGRGIKLDLRSSLL